MFTNDTTDAEGNPVLMQNIYVDINGSKQPNTFGKDVFVFERVLGKGFLLLGHEQPISTINSSCRKSGVGTFCARKIMSDGWKINYLK